MENKVAGKKVCSKCKKIIKTREVLCCYFCKKYYDINCAQVSSTRFDIMEKSKKETWKCNTCYATKAKQPETSKYTNTPSSSNVTKRGPRQKPILLTPSHKSQEENSSSSSDDDLLSLPDMGTYQNEREVELMNEVTHWKLELEIAHNEIENLNMENAELKKQIEEKETLAVKWKKLFTEAMSTPKRRGSSSKKAIGTQEQKTMRPFIQARSLDLEQENRNAAEENENTPKSGITRSKKQHQLEGKVVKRANKNYVPSNAPYKQILIANTITKKTKIEVPKTKSSKVIVFSDSIGQGLAVKMIEKTDCQAVNNCKPDAGFLKILENYEGKISNLGEKDTVAILITKYENSLYYKKHKYIQLLNKLVKNQERKFNILITGLRFNDTHDSEIYDINRLIANIANANENVKYLDPNIKHEYTKNYKLLKKFVTESVITYIERKLPGSSSLRFIKCQEQTDVMKKGRNFLTPIGPIQVP